MATVVDELVTRLSLIGLEEYGSRFQKASKSMAAWTAVAVAGGTVATFAGRQIVDAYKAAADEQATFATASGNFKGSLPVDELNELATRLSRLTAVEDGAIAGTVGLLGTYQMLGSQAKQIILPLLNASRALEAQGQSSEGLAVAIGKAFQGGNLGALRRFGIFVDEAAFKTDRLGALIDALQQQGGNAAVEFGRSAAGGMQRFNNAVGDLQESIGGKLLPALTPAVETATKFVEAIADNGTAATVTAAILGGAVVAGTVAATVATWRLYTAVVALGNAYSTTGAKAAAAAGGGGKFLSGGVGKAGVAGLALGLGAAGIGMIPDGGNQKAQGLKSVGEGTLAGAGIGATIGAMFGGVGAVPGGLIGAALGAVSGAASHMMNQGKSPAENPQLAELQKQTKLLETMATGGGRAVDFNRLSIAQQRAIMAYGVAIA